MKPMTNEEMAAKLERDAKFYDDHRTPVLLAIARRIRLLEAEVKAWRRAEHLRKSEPHNEFVTLADARAALDADERGEVKDGN